MMDGLIEFVGLFASFPEILLAGLALGFVVWSVFDQWRERARRRAMTPEECAAEDERTREEGQLW